MMDTQLAEMLGDIRETLGGINGKLDSLHDTFKQHVAEDNAVEVRVRGIELALEKQKGKASVWGMITNVGSALLGAAAAYWGSKHV